MSIPGENIPGPHIRMTVSMPHTRSMHEGQVQLSVVAHIVCMTFVWDAWCEVSSCARGEGTICLVHCLREVVRCLLMEVGVPVLDIVKGCANSSLPASRLVQHGISRPGIAGHGAPSFFVLSDPSDGLIYSVGVWADIRIGEGYRGPRDSPGPVAPILVAFVTDDLSKFRL